jgi:hypothetical protein
MGKEALLIFDESGGTSDRKVSCNKTSWDQHATDINLLNNLFVGASVNSNLIYQPINSNIYNRKKESYSKFAV